MVGRTVLVATHLAPESDPVVTAALELARTMDMQAVLAHAEAPIPLLFGSPGGGIVADPSAYRDESESLRAALAEQATRCAKGGPLPAVDLTAGLPDLALAEAAQRHRAELLVLGAPRRPEFGTTADRLLRRLDLPVLVLRRPDRFPPRRVLAAVDLSEPSERALRLGVELLGRIAGSTPREFELLFVLSPRELEGSVHFRADRLKAFAVEELDRLARRAAPHAAGSFERCIHVGEARDVILEEAKSRPADLLLLGTHGRSGLDRWLLGSVASSVLRRAETNVLVVPSHGAPPRTPRTETSG